MVDDTAGALREMALHRGLKLVKSRRRKPGTGDFGKFGLTDETGKQLLGFGRDGLTASASEIENYLRAGATNTWAQSAQVTPDRKPEPRSQASTEDLEEKPSRHAAATRPRGKQSTTESAPSRTPKTNRRPTRAPAPQPPPAATQKPPRRPAPIAAEPTLTLRTAKASDAAALASLLGQLSGITSSEHEVARHLASLRKSGASVQVAELGQIVGCVGWAIVPTLQRGAVGRITVLIVDDRHRRRGIATTLLAHAEADLGKKGCALLEAISDTDIKNAHGFFRTAKFEQKSYRFVRPVTGA